MAKIIIDAREYSTSTGRYIRKLIDYLQDIDQENEYVVLIYPKDLPKFKAKSNNFRAIPTKYKKFTFSEQIGFAWQLYRLKADLVHFGMVQQPILYFGPCVTTMHDLTTLRFKNPTKNKFAFWAKQQVYKFVNIIASHKSKAIIVPTNFVKDDVAHYCRVSKNKIRTTYEAADLIADKPVIIDHLADKKFIAYVGRPLPHKNLGRLIEAFAVLKKTHPDLLLAIAGKKDAMHDIHLSLATKLKVKDSIVFTGFISDAQLKWMYQNTSAYVFPSLSEGFGLPGLEAMVHGAPVVSSNATCLPDVYGDAALYFDPNDVQDMAIKIDRLISDVNLQKELFQKGKNRAQKYSWHKMATQTLSIYKSALK